MAGVFDSVVCWQGRIARAQPSTFEPLQEILITFFA